MTRRRKIGLGCGGTLLVTLLALVATAYFSMFYGMKKLGPGATLADPHAHLIVDGFAAIYVLDVGDGTAVLVDAGNDANGAALLAGLTALHYDPAHVRAVLLTHGHPDHVAGLHVLPGVEVAALPADAPLVAGTSMGHSPMASIRGPTATGLRVTHPLHDGETLHYGDLSVDVFAIPGHTPGSAAYVARGVVYLGDSAGARDDGTIRGAPWVVSDSQSQNVASLRSLATRLRSRRGELHGLAFGHQAPLDSVDALFAF